MLWLPTIVHIAHVPELTDIVGIELLVLKLKVSGTIFQLAPVYPINISADVIGVEKE